MRNNFLYQNDQKHLHHQLSASKIILKSNGKISLSKSTKPHSQRDTKTNQINSLKKQIFKLKCQLQEQKIENKKVTILSNEIRKVKEKLIRKIGEKNSRDSEQMNFQNPQKRKYENISRSRMNEKQTVKETISNQEVQTLKVSLLRDSTDQIFKNFSLIKSLSKKSEGVQPFQNPVKQIQQNSRMIYLDEIESMESRQIVQSRLNEKFFKMKNRQNSFLEDKTVKQPSLREKYKNWPKFFNQCQENEIDQNNKMQPQTQKLSVTNCINLKRNRKKQNQYK